MTIYLYNTLFFIGQVCIIFPMLELHNSGSCEYAFRKSIFAHSEINLKLTLIELFSE